MNCLIPLEGLLGLGAAAVPDATACVERLRFFRELS